MADYKFTFIGQGGVNYGWSESFYWSGGDLDDAKAAAKKYKDLRDQTIASNGQARIVACRIVSQDKTKIMKLVRYDPPAAKPNDALEEMPWTTASVRMYSANGAVRSMQVHALSDPDVIAPWWSSEALANLGGLLNPWIALLVNTGFRMRTRGFPTKVPLSDVVPTTDGYELRFGVAQTFETGDMLKLFRVRTVGAPLQGFVRVIKVSGLRYKVVANVGKFTFVEGKIYKPGPVLSAIAKAKVTHLSDRMPGRPFDLLRGRRLKCHR